MRSHFLLPDFFPLVSLNPRRSSVTLLVMLEDRKVAYGFLISKQEKKKVVCANPFSFLEYGFFALLRCFCWLEGNERRVKPLITSSL